MSSKHEWIEKLPFNLAAAFHKHTIKNFDSSEKIGEVKKFFVENPSDKKRAIQQGLEAAEENVSWLEQNGEDVADFFTKYVSP